MSHVLVIEPDLLELDFLAINGIEVILQRLNLPHTFLIWQVEEGDEYHVNIYESSEKH